MAGPVRFGRGGDVSGFPGTRDRGGFGARGRGGFGGRSPGRFGARRVRGAYALEFILVFIGSLLLFVPAAEFMRLSLIDQALAQSAYEGAQALSAASFGTTCDDSIALEALNENFLRGRLGFFDYDGDGEVDSQPSAWAPTITIESDLDLADGDPFETAGCGGAQSWVRVTLDVNVRPWGAPFRAIWPNGIPRRAQSWAMRSQSS